MIEGLNVAIEQPVSIREQVYRRISELILKGHIAAGQRIMENKLSKLLGVSRTPIREALHVLEMEGFLEVIPRVGYQVRQISWDELEEICEIRKINETLAACWAIEKITTEELSSLRDNLYQAERDVKAGHPELFTQYDAGFHDIIVRASGSKRLIEICQTLRRHMLLYRIESFYDVDMIMGVIADHHTILDRLEARDTIGITEAISKHLDHVKHEVRYYAFEMKKDGGTVR